MRKILIVDDKNPTDTQSSVALMAQLDEKQKSLVDFFASADNLWREVEGEDDIELLINFSIYEFVFIHDSYNDPMVEGLLPVLIQHLSKTSNVILFSGSKDVQKTQPVSTDEVIAPGINHYEIRRKTYFYNFRNFVDSALFFEDYALKYLYDSYTDPKKDFSNFLLKKINGELDKSVEQGISSDFFQQLLDLHVTSDHKLIKERLINVDKTKVITWIKTLIEP